MSIKPGGWIWNTTRWLFTWPVCQSHYGALWEGVMWKSLRGGLPFGDFSMCSVVSIGMPLKALSWVPCKTQAGGKLAGCLCWTLRPHHPWWWGANKRKTLLSHLCAPNLVLAFIVSKVVHAQLLSRFRLFVTPWTVVLQSPLFMGLSRQKYWSGLPFSPAGDLLDPGIKPMSPPSPSSAGRFFTIVLPGKPYQQSHLCSNSVLS